MSTPRPRPDPRRPARRSANPPPSTRPSTPRSTSTSRSTGEEPRRLDAIVFGITAALAIGFVLWGFTSTSTLSSASTAGLGWVVHNMGWLFALVASGFVLFVIWLAAGKFGRIPLGRDDEGPEFKTVSWIAMMFSAGMGIGLMFYGVSEPLMHFVTPPPGTGAPEQPRGRPERHGDHAVPLDPAPVGDLRGGRPRHRLRRLPQGPLPAHPGSAFAPLLGEKRANGPAGGVIDILAIFATLFGSAASLGLERTGCPASRSWPAWARRATPSSSRSSWC